MRCLFLLALAISCVSCGTSPTMSSVACNPQPRPGPVIARIVSRHDTLVIRAGDTGPTYSLETARGEVLVPDMTPGKLALESPTLFQRVKAMQDSVMWAGTRE